MSNDRETEADIVARDKAALERGERPDHPSPLTCPECGGVLWELHNNNVLRFRCHVGHAYSVDGLMVEQSDGIEKALWSAVRVLEERAALARRMATQAHQQNRLLSEKQFSEQAREAEQNAVLVRQIILQNLLNAENETESRQGETSTEWG